MEHLIRRWEEAERRLYPSMMAQPDTVADYMRLVRAVADDLGAVSSVGGLVDAWNRGMELADAAARRRGVSAGAPDLELVAGAAFSLRYRELAAEARQEEVRRQIEQARTRGEAWVVLDEAGMAEAPFPQPYRRVEMRVADGYTLHLSAELDPDSGRILYAVEGLRLEPATGEMIDLAQPRRREFTDRQEWLRTARELRDHGPPG